MHSTIRLIVLLGSCGLIASTATPTQKGGGSVDRVLEELVALERGALDRWIRLDPQGYLDLVAPEVTYFDPTTESRVDGLKAMQARLAPMKNMKLPFADPRYEMIGPKVQRQGDVALFTFNLVNYGKLAGQPESVLARWNSTEVYARIGGRWKIIHSHWSFVQPQVTGDALRARIAAIATPREQDGLRRRGSVGHRGRVLASRARGSWLHGLRMRVLVKASADDGDHQWDEDRLHDIRQVRCRLQFVRGPAVRELRGRRLGLRQGRPCHRAACRSAARLRSERLFGLQCWRRSPRSAARRRRCRAWITDSRVDETTPNPGLPHE